MTLLTGTRLGPYAIENLLGKGGMGEVYRAKDTRLDRHVAVKVLTDRIDTDAHRARFRREAKVISSLAHPHICAIHDIGVESGTEYLVLELLEGETLAARLARGPLPISQVVRLGSQIADALATAHQHGIVHRDLKPGNIMLTGSGVKLLDFGLAKALAPLVPDAMAPTVVGEGPATAEGAIVGTLRYMAPEQVQGLPTDARTDIFALGLVLFEMATGRSAFEGSTQARVMASILDADAPRLSSLVPLAPPALEPGLHVDSWTPDGRFIVARSAGTAVYLVSPVDRTARQLVDTPYVEDECSVSPDGRWVAFNSDSRARGRCTSRRFPISRRSSRSPSVAACSPAGAAMVENSSTCVRMPR